MHTTVAWLRELSIVPAPDFHELIRPIIVPGFTPIKLTNCIIRADPSRVLSSRVGDAYPLSMSVLRVPDAAPQPSILKREHDLVGELAAFLTLITERKIVVPDAIPISLEGSSNVSFLGYGIAMDRRLIGPMPQTIESSLHTVLAQVAGLPEPALAAIGAAIRLHYAAVELFEEDVRSAYLLLVAGIEVLSRAFGGPPSDWLDWEEAARWDQAFRDILLTDDQAAALRERLMKDRNLRLKATFRNYAAQSVPDALWDDSLQEWGFPFDIKSGNWMQAPLPDTVTVDSVLPRDRVALAAALGKSYDCRSGLVHRGEDLDLRSMTLGFQARLDMTRPLPFAILRSILRHLIRKELDARANPVTLPDVLMVRPAGT